MACSPFQQKTGLGIPWGSDSHQHHDRRSSARVSLSSPSFPLSSSFGCFSGVSSSCHQRICSRPSLEEHHPENQSSSASVLFQPFHSSQERWPEPSNHRPVHPQHLPHSSQIQDGKSFLHCRGHCGTHVGRHHRPERRLLPRPRGLALPSFSGLRGGWTGLCFSVPPIWPFNSPLGLLSHNQANQSPSPSSFVSLPHLSGRFLSDGYLQTCSSGEALLCSLPSGQVGDYREPPEVEFSSLPDTGLLGSHIPSRLPPVVSSTSQGTADNVSLLGDFSSSSLLSPPSGEPSGASQFRLLFSPPRSSSAPASHGLDELAHVCPHTRSSSPSRCGFAQVSPGLDGPSVSLVSGLHVSSCSISPVNDGCLDVGLGRCSGPSLHLGDLARTPQRVLHQFSGADGGLPLCSTLPSSSPVRVCSGPHGQHHCHCLHPQSRHSEISQASGSYNISPGVLPPTLHTPLHEAHLRHSQCPGGQALACLAHLNRVESGSPDVSLALLPVSSSTGRPFCHQGEPSAPSLCVSLPGSRSSGGQCNVSFLGRMGVHLPISPGTAVIQGCTPPCSIPRQGDIGGSLLPSGELAPASSLQSPEAASSSIGPQPVSGHQFRAGISPEPVRILPSRVGTIRRGLLSAGFSEDSADIYLLIHKDSSTRQYQSIWSKFLLFLTHSGIPHSSISIASVCNFLSHHAKVRGRLYRTVSGYRCALRLPLLWSCGLDVNCFTTDQFLRGLFNFRPPQRSRPMPIWNVNVLLEFLSSSRFEPLDSVDFLLLAQKTLCLLLLASGRRIGEIASLSRSHSVSSSGATLTLDWVPGFRPKHHEASFQPPCPSIHFLADDGSSDLGLCPVRAYRVYLQRSSSWFDSRSSPDASSFFWISPHSSPLSISHLTGIFISAVKDSLHASGLTAPASIGPHQMRKLAASLSLGVGQDEELVRANMGFSSLSILRKNYVARVPKLKHSCVLPGGPFLFTGNYQLSESE